MLRLLIVTVLAGARLSARAAEARFPGATPQRAALRGMPAEPALPEADPVSRHGNQVHRLLAGRLADGPAHVILVDVEQADIGLIERGLETLAYTPRCPWPSHS